MTPSRQAIVDEPTKRFFARCDTNVRNECILISVDDIKTSRFNSALELFREGHILRFDSVGFRLTGEHVLNVKVESSWWIGNIDDARAYADLHRAKSVLEYLTNNSPEFSNIVSGRALNFSLIYFDGRDAIELGKFIGDKIVWM